MSLRDTEYQYIKLCLDSLNKPYNQINMIELGNQVLSAQKVFRGIAKVYFSSLGINHLSLDLNAKDGSIPIDLSVPTTKYVDWSDITTNGGTLEHIPKKQEVAFENVHRMTKCGGFMIHSLPLQNKWRGHCPHRYSNKFVEKLAKANGYLIIKNEVLQRPKRNSDNILIHTALKKVDDKPFVISRDWLNEISYTSKYKHNTDNLK